MNIVWGDEFLLLTLLDEIGRPAPGLLRLPRLRLPFLLEERPRPLLLRHSSGRGRRAAARGGGGGGGIGCGGGGGAPPLLLDRRRRSPSLFRPPRARNEHADRAVEFRQRRLRVRRGHRAIEPEALPGAVAPPPARRRRRRSRGPSCSPKPRDTETISPSLCRWTGVAGGTWDRPTSTDPLGS